MTLKQINKHYENVFNNIVEVYFDNDTLFIIIDGREVVTVSNISEDIARAVAEDIIHKFYFSFHLAYSIT